MTFVAIPVFNSCWPETFIVNGKRAYSFDFGLGYDDAPNENAPYRCGDFQWHRYPETSENARHACEKYGLTIEDYRTICADLEEKLSVGSCGSCE